VPGVLCHRRRGGTFLGQGPSSKRGFFFWGRCGMGSWTVGDGIQPPLGKVFYLLSKALAVFGSIKARIGGASLRARCAAHCQPNTRARSSRWIRQSRMKADTHHPSCPHRIGTAYPQSASTTQIRFPLTIVVPPLAVIVQSGPQNPESHLGPLGIQKIKSYSVGSQRTTGVSPATFPGRGGGSWGTHRRVEGPQSAPLSHPTCLRATFV